MNATAHLPTRASWRDSQKLLCCELSTKRYRVLYGRDCCSPPCVPGGAAVASGPWKRGGGVRRRLHCLLRYSAPPHSFVRKLSSASSFVLKVQLLLIGHFQVAVTGTRAYNGIQRARFKGGLTKIFVSM